MSSSASRTRASLPTWRTARTACGWRQPTSPETPGYEGFSPRPTPELIATYKIPHGGHLRRGIAKGLDRDRAVDESGNQIGVFGTVPARPLNLEEQQRLYLRGGKVWRVSDDPSDPYYHRAIPAK